MGLFDRISRVFRANLNDLVSKAEDPEKVLEQAVIDMQENLVQLRQAVARTIAEQKRTEKQYTQNQEEANKWQQRAQLALQKGDEELAREALVRKKNYAETAQVLKTQLDNQVKQVETLKKQLIALESKISEAKTKKNMLKARAQAAQANRQLQEAVGNMSTNSAMAAFERMEDKVVSLEAESQAAYELGGSGLEDQFKQLESGTGVDDELMALKAQMSGGALPGAAPTQQALPESQAPQDKAQTSAVDTELEELRNQLRKS
jgi:phage shock protein A